MDIWSTANVMDFPGSRDDSRAVRDANAQQVPRDPGFQSGAPCLSFGNHRQKEALYWPYPACSTGTHRLCCFLCCFPGHSLRSLMCPLLLPQNRLLRKDFRFRPGSGRCRCPVSRRDSVCRRYPVSRPGSVCRRCPVSRPGSVCRRYPVSRPVLNPARRLCLSRIVGLAAPGCSQRQ